MTVIPSCQSKESKITGRDLQENISVEQEDFTKGRAISLKILQEKVKDCMEKRNCPENIFQLFGLKKVVGYVIDEKNRDLILIGKIDDSMPSLYLEDFVIALRNTWMVYAELRGNTYYYSNPGCSIDPDPRILTELNGISSHIFNISNPEKVQRNLNQWHSVCQQPQQVRVMGIPFDTRFGKVMVEADYYMKRLVDGSVSLDINGFTSLTDMTLDITRKEIEEGKPISVPLSSLNRFWFYPGENSYLEDKGVIYIKKSDVKLLNEEEFLTRGGELVGTGRPNPLAERFAQSFSEKYAEIAKRKPIYTELEGLFRFVALARIMKHRNAVSEAGISLDYLLNQYPVTNTSVSRTLSGISNIKEFKYKSETHGGYSVLYLWLPSCGGVSIDINIKDKDIALDKTKTLFEIKKSILDTRPSPDTLYWDFPVMWKVKDIDNHLVRESSSPITERESVKADNVKDIPKTLADRLEDIKKASRDLKNGLIVDLFIGEKDDVHVNIVDAGGNVNEVSPEVSEELRKLLKIITTTYGKPGSTLITRWQKFYDSNLSHLIKPRSWTGPDGRTVKIKPILIIKVNEVNYKYANLEKVPVLADNFIIFIASKTRDVSEVSETSANTIVAKINNIPKLNKNNMTFIIRLPEVSKVEKQNWDKEINSLQNLVGRENVLVDPSKEEFENMLQKRGKDVVVFELTHTDRGILLKNDERYTSKNIQQGTELSHIKYLISGIGTCNLPRLEDGRFTASLREKGVGIINTSNKEVSTEIALKRLRELIDILQDIEQYDVYPYNLIDIIDQRLGITGEGTSNLGKKESPEKYSWG